MHRRMTDWGVFLFGVCFLWCGLLLLRVIFWFGFAFRLGLFFGEQDILVLIILLFGFVFGLCVFCVCHWSVFVLVRVCSVVDECSFGESVLVLCFVMLIFLWILCSVIGFGVCVLVLCLAIVLCFVLDLVHCYWFRLLLVVCVFLFVSGVWFVCVCACLVCVECCSSFGGCFWFDGVVSGLRFCVLCLVCVWFLCLRGDSWFVCCFLVCVLFLDLRFVSWFVFFFSSSAGATRATQGEHGEQDDPGDLGDWCRIASLWPKGQRRSGGWWWFGRVLDQ